MTNQEKLLEAAKSAIGTDFTPDWIVPDEVSCAYAVSLLWRKVDPSLPVITGTASMDSFMRNDDRFEEIAQPISSMEPGWITVSPTGQGANPSAIPNGHVGIYLDNMRIMSNDSYSGLWEANFTRDSWRNRFLYKGGYPIRVYRLK